FVVTVTGGLGSIPGAFVAAVVIGIVKALCIGLGTVDIAGWSIAFPKLTLVAEFIVMAIVLTVRPQGLLGRAIDAPSTTVLPEQRAWLPPLSRRDALIALLLVMLLAALPAMSDEYTQVLAT